MDVLFIADSEINRRKCMEKKRVRKAIIPAAGFGTRFLPATKAVPKEMLPIVDIPTIQYIIEEAVAAGIEEICLVTNSYKQCIENHFDVSYELEEKLKKSNDIKHLEMVQSIADMVNIISVRQKNPRGLGHAILCAQHFVADEPVAVLLGDDIVINKDGKTAIEQLIDVYNETGGSVVGVQKVAHENVYKYGIIDPKTSIDARTMQVERFVEKPAVDEAPSDMAILGRYILTPDIFEYLLTQDTGAGGEIQLTDAIDRLAKDKDVYAYDFEGKRYDVGDRKGFLQAQVEFALDREDTHDAMVEIIENLGYTKK
jgi:UTP--glucose-1-phosphate uridylyltransferase